MFELAATTTKVTTKAPFTRKIVPLEYLTMDNIQTPNNPKDIQSLHFGKFLSFFSVVPNEIAINYESDLLCHAHLILIETLIVFVV
jgi:hypothetical protein